MADYTSEVAELSAAYQANRSANAVINTEVRGKYRAIIAAEIEERKATNDKKFADHLARVKERSGIPVGVIQDHILHTKSWDRWTYWRDLGEIPAEQVSRSLAREERRAANSPFVWADDFSTLTVRKNSLGGSVDPVTYYMSTLRNANGRWMPDTDIENDSGVSQAYRAARATDMKGWRTYVSDEIQRQIDAGNVEEPGDD